jgi:ribosomal protein L27
MYGSPRGLNEGGSIVSMPQRQVRMVPTAKVREWLVWFGARSTQDPKNTENRRLSNRLYDFCQRAGAPGSILVARGTAAATTAEVGGDGTGFDWTKGEIAFAPRPGFGPKAIERLITRVVAVTGIRE